MPSCSRRQSCNMSFPSRPRIVPGAPRTRGAQGAARPSPPAARVAAPRWLFAARALYGGALVLAPRHALGVRVGELDGRMRTFARVLGARNLAEAALLRAHPSRGWALAGAAVDATHAATMVIVAAIDRRGRAIALTSALVASAFAAWGARSARPLSSGTHGAARAPLRRSGWELEQ
jgi:hypothetical protein